MVDAISSNPTLLAMAVLLFVAAFVGVEALYIWWNSSRGPDATRIANRLRTLSAGGNHEAQTASLLKQRLLSDTPWLGRLLLFVPRVKSIDRFLVQSGTDWSVGSLTGLCIGLLLTGMLGALVLRFPIEWALLIGLVLMLLPTQYLLLRRAKRLRRFEAQLPEALDLIGRALRAGHAFSSALQMAGNEMPEPIGPEFKQAFDEINYGVPTQHALENLASRVPSLDLSFFVISVLIQRETGGNLAEVLDNISSIIRDRLTLLGKVQALSAEGRFSGWVLAMLPFGTATMLYIVQPEFMLTLWIEPLGRMMIYTGIVLMLLGGFWMRRIVRIHV